LSRASACAAYSKELLDLSRLDARAIDIDPRPVALRAALADIVAGALPHNSLELDVRDDLEAILDPLALDRVVTNLLVNAAHYGVAPIHVEVRQHDLHLSIAVEDSGPGIPPELEDRIFDRFARGTQSGHGLGLAIARAYAQAHGGDLVYDPRGNGARFVLLIPQQTRESTPVSTS
jgi:signal transduction histidine kinase